MELLFVVPVCFFCFIAFLALVSFMVILDAGAQYDVSDEPVRGDKKWAARLEDAAPRFDDDLGLMEVDE